MIITFGKHSGLDTTLLAKCAEGRQYLSWGAEKLKSATWRSAFQQALDSVSLSQVSLEEQADATVKVLRDISYEDVLYWLQQEAADNAAWAIQEQAVVDAQAILFAEWSAVSGRSVADLQVIYRRYENDWQDAPANLFSSADAHRRFVEYMGKLSGCWEVVPFSAWPSIR